MTKAAEVEFELKCPWCGCDVDYGLLPPEANLEAHAEEPCDQMVAEGIGG